VKIYMKITVSGLLFTYEIPGTLTLVYITGESVVVRIAKYRYGNSGPAFAIFTLFGRWGETGVCIYFQQ
jgi:hypothetical protein